MCYESSRIGRTETYFAATRGRSLVVYPREKELLGPDAAARRRLQRRHERRLWSTWIGSGLATERQRKHKAKAVSQPQKAVENQRQSHCLSCTKAVQCGAQSKGSVLATKGSENKRQRLCHSLDGSGNTRQRQCLSHEGSGSTRQRHCLGPKDGDIYRQSRSRAQR